MRLAPDEGLGVPVAGAACPGRECRQIQSPALKSLIAEVAAILQKPEVKEQFAKLGITSAPMKPDEFARFVREQIGVYQKVVKSAGIEPQ